MVKLFRMLMGVSIMVLLLACAPRVAPAPTPAPTAPQAASPLPVPVAPVISAEETDWQKVVAAAKEEKSTLIVYSQMAPDALLALGQTFYERTGVRVENVTGDTRTHIERVKTERRAGAMVASVVYGIILVAITSKQDGLLQRIGYLPSLANEAEWVQSPIADKEGYIIVSAGNILGPWINTQLVKPGEEPRSWRDLLQPQWNGKIGQVDPAVGMGGLGRLFYYSSRQGILDEAYFRQLGKQVKWSVTDWESARQLAVGETHIMGVTGATVVGRFVLQGAPLKAIEMEDVMIGLIAEPGTLLDRAPHPNAGRLFLNFVWSKEGQTLLHKNTGTRSLRKDVPDFTLPAGQISPKRVIWTTLEGEMGVQKFLGDKKMIALFKGQ